MAICHRVELRVYDRTGTGSYTVLPAAGVKFSTALGGGGFLSATAESRAEPIASNPDLLDDCVIKVAVPLAEPGTTLTEVLAYANRARNGTLWGGAGAQTREIRNAPTLFTAWSQDAILHPEGNTITQMMSDQRYFGWMSSIYNPTGDGWLTPATIGQQDSHGYTSRTDQPADWPADLGDAYWITASGGNGARHLFIADLTLSTPTGVTVFFSSDESAAVYVAGSLVIQTSSVEGGYQSMDTWQGLLQAGTYRIGIDKTSIDHTGFDLGYGGDSGPADPVLLAVAVGDGSGGWTPLLVTNTTDWQCYGLDPEMGEPPSLTPGAIVVELAAQAAARGVDTWSALALDFDADFDSDAQPWPVREERAWRVAYDRHLDMLEGLGDLGFCPDITPAGALQGWGNRGTDLSATVTIAALNHIDQADESGVGVVGTYMPVETQDGWVVVQNPVAAATYGRRETALSLGNAPSIAQGKRLGQKVLDERLSKPETEWTIQFYARTGAVPFADFNVGDTIMVSINGTSTPRVVLDLGAEADHTEGILRWTAKTGDTALPARFATQPGNALAEGGVGSLVGDEAGGSATFVTTVGTATAAGEVGSLVGATGGAATFATTAGTATASGGVGSLSGSAAAATFATTVGTATASGGVGSLSGDAGNVSFVAASSTGVAGSGAVTPGMPSGATTGDLLLLHIEGLGEDADADGGPSGWTLVGSAASATDGAADRTRNTVYWAWYDAGLSLTVPDAGDHTYAIITAWRGVDETTPFDATVVSTTNASNLTSHTATGITTVTANAMVVVSITHGDDGLSVSAGTLDGNMMATAADYSSNFNSDGTIAVRYREQASAGASGDAAWTTAAGEERAVLVMALRPA